MKRKLVHLPGSNAGTTQRILTPSVQGSMAEHWPEYKQPHKYMVKYFTAVMSIGGKEMADTLLATATCTKWNVILEGSFSWCMEL